MNRFVCLGMVGWSVLLCGCDSGSDPGSGGAAAVHYPRRSITLICPWAEGGGTYRLSHWMAMELEKELGQPVVVMSREGGSGAVGHSTGAHAAPDGYTITMATFELSTMHAMGISELTHADFAPVIQLNADAAALIVRSDAPWRSVQDFLQYIKLHPGKLKMSGTATGGAWDLARAGLLLAAGLPVNVVLWVPAQGAAPSLVELLGGHIDAVCCSVPEARAQVEAGQLRVLGVMSPERLAEFPDIPTVREAGIPWDAVGWRGLMVPRGTPPEIVSLLYERCRAITGSEAFQQFMKENGFAVAIRDPQSFRQFLQDQDVQWQNVIVEAGYARK